MLKAITPYLSYLPASEQPLSADVFVIRGERRTYIFDVGNNEQARKLISGVAGKKIIILSHFHPDHIGNIGSLTCDELYVGKQTYDKIHAGTIIRDSLVIEDGIRLEIRHCVSPHAKGSLIVTVNGEYTLLGDLYYTKPGCKLDAARQMLGELRKLSTQYVVVSHAEKNVFEKEVLVRELNEYFYTEG